MKAEGVMQAAYIHHMTPYVAIFASDVALIPCKCDSSAIVLHLPICLRLREQSHINYLGGFTRGLGGSTPRHQLQLPLPS